MTPHEIGLIVKRLCGAYPQQTVNVDKGAMTLSYGDGLIDLDYRQCDSAVAELSKIEEFLPAISKIRQKVAEYNHGRRKFGLEAWKEVIGEISRVGRHGVPVFRDQITKESVSSVGGWLAICDSDSGSASVRARFCEIYDALAQRVQLAVQISPGAKARALLPQRNESACKLGDFIAAVLPMGDKDEQ